MSEFGEWDASTEISVEPDHPITVKRWLKKISIPLYQGKELKKEKKEMTIRPVNFNSKKGLEKFALKLTCEEKQWGGKIRILTR